MATTAITRFAHEEIKPNIGSRILNSKAELLAGDLGPQIRELLEQRGVLVFPKIDFDDDEQIAFTKTLGTFAPEMQDGTNHKIWILRRSDMEVIGEFGHGGRQVGQMLRPHGMSIDSRGNLYVGEASTGRRVQKFTLVAK